MNMKKETGKEDKLGSIYKVVKYILGIIKIIKKYFHK